MREYLSRLQGFIWHPRENRLRAPYRILLFVITLGVSVAILGLIIEFSDVTIGDSFDEGVTLPVILILSLPAYALTVLIGSRILDRRPVKNYGLDVDRNWVNEYGIGFIIGASLLSLTVGFQLLFGWVEVTEIARNTTEYPFIAMSVLVITTVAGLYVLELTASVFILKNSAEGLSGYLSPEKVIILAVGVSFIFHFLFRVNLPEATSYAILVEVCLHLIILLVYIYTGNAGFSIGFGTGWILFAIYVFGTTTSSLMAPVSVMTLDITGPVAITGGEFGVDGGLAALFSVVFGLFLVFGWLRVTDRLTVPESIYTRVDRLDN